MKSEEKVIVLPASLVRAAMRSSYVDLRDSPVALDSGPLRFMRRGDVEIDETYKQPIVYTLVTYKGKYLRYSRGKAGGERRLHAHRSIGIGGHINPDDVHKVRLCADTAAQWRGALSSQPFWKSAFKRGVAQAAYRELEEEIGLQPSALDEVVLLGLVNEDQSAVGRVHFGIVFVASLKSTDGLKYEDAIVDPEWVTLDDLAEDTTLEEWSKIVMRHMCSTGA